MPTGKKLSAMGLDWVAAVVGEVYRGEDAGLCLSGRTMEK